MIILKQVAFTLYDMNSDGSICEYDLFSMIKNNKNMLFIDTLNQDFKDIRAKMATKAVEMNLQNAPIVQNKKND